MNNYRVLHLPYGYFPDPVGGTEFYVQALARELVNYGIRSIIAAPAKENAQYTIENIPVFRYAVSNGIHNLRHLYGEGDPCAAQEFTTILDTQQPDLVHMHAFTSGISLRVAQIVKQRNIPIVFTYHTPTVTCQRGTLMRWGETVCDGRLTRQRCTACTLHDKGIAKFGSKALSLLPPLMGELVSRIGLQSSMWTAVRMGELIHLRHNTIRQLFDEVDHIIAVCGWINAVLQVNQVPQHKITLCRHGLAHISASYPHEKRRAQQGDVLRMVFLGRLHPTKGVDIVLQAIKALPEAPIQFDIYGIIQDGSEAYSNSLRQLAQDDHRIRFLAAVAGGSVIDLLATYDLLVVPSQWLETGPLVILEAFAAGIPVIGSNLGGIAEWVEDGVNGILVKADSVAAWRLSLATLVQDLSRLDQLSQQIQPPRTMRIVADEMQAIYRKLLNGRAEHRYALSHFD